VTGTTSTVLIAAAAVVLVALVVTVLLAVRARSRSGASQALPGPASPPSPTAIVCSFCNREYDPAETGGRCPGCGAAAPRKR
jgi:hypothetical protein